MKPFYETRLFRHFLPFMVLVVGGSFFLREFAQIRYKYKKVSSYDFREDVKAQGLELKKPVTLEEEYERTVKTMDLDNWENVRIPRPWEEPNAASN